MPEATEAAKPQSSARQLRLTLNSDGQRHPVENALTIFAFVAGIVAFATGLIVRQHLRPPWSAGSPSSSACTRR